MNRREFIGAVAGGILAGYSLDHADAREQESFADREKKYQITVDDAPNPEAYAAKFTELLKEALTSDCTPENAEAYTKRTSTLSGDLNIDKKNEFDPAIVSGLFGFLPNQGLSAIFDSPAYQMLHDAHQGIMTHYIGHLSETGDSERFDFDQQGYDVSGSDDTIYGLSIDVSITNDLEDGDPHKVALEGTIRLGVEPEVRGDGVYRANLGTRFNDTALFQDLADLDR